MSERNKGIVCIILAAFCFAFMNLFVKLSGDLPFIEKSFFRNLVALLFALGIITKNHVPMKCTNGSLKYLLARSIGGTIGIFCNFYAIDRLVISDASMLNKLSPFFAIIFSYFLLKEKIKPYQIFALILAFIGTLFILKPGFNNLISFPALIGMLGGVAAGFAYTNVRLASGKGVPGAFIVFFFSTFSCVSCIPFMIGSYVPLTGIQLLYLLLAGLSASGGQFAITAAYSHAPASEISVYDYSQIIFAALLGMLFLGELPDGFSLLGYLIICSASVYMFLKNRRPN